MSDPADDVVDEAEIADQHEPSPDNSASLAHYEKLRTKQRNGANWFFWIAGLSVANSFVLLTEGNFHFLVGLGIIEFVDGFAIALGWQSPETALVAKAVAVVFTFIAAGVFATFGFGARRGLSWVFMMGLVGYLLDGLLVAYFRDRPSTGFHAFAFLGIRSGSIACRQLNALNLEFASEGEGA